jgi:hypothetical protein
MAQADRGQPVGVSGAAFLRRELRQVAGAAMDQGTGSCQHGGHGSGLRHPQLAALPDLIDPALRDVV